MPVRVRWGARRLRPIGGAAAARAKEAMMIYVLPHAAILPPPVIVDASGACVVKQMQTARAKNYSTLTTI